MKTENIKSELNVDTHYENFFHCADYGRTYYNQRDPRLVRASFSTAEKYFLDPQVSACFLITVFSVLNKVGQFEPITQDQFTSKAATKSKNSKKLADFLNYTLRRFQGSEIQLKYDLLVSKY